jgi:hypothetical protein
MNREELRELLIRAVRDKLLTIEQAAELLRRFDRGDLDVGPESTPLALREAADVTTNAHAEEALVLLLLFLFGRNQSDGARAASRLSGLPDIRRTDALDTLADRFALRASQLSAELGRTRDLARFHRAARALVRTSILQRHILGAGRPPTPGELAALSLRIRAQHVYLSRFADEIAVRNLDGSPLSEMSERAVRARLELYEGEARAAFYFAQEADAEPGTVVYYVALDDAGTCSPCFSADLNSPYLPGDPDSPYPGRVCRGRGRCRCRRELRYNPSAYRRLAERAA